MAKEEREIERWITANGARIPIYKGQSIDEAIKERQIEENKKIADKKNKKEDYTGKHTVYRAGDLSGGGTGLIYFATNRETAERYGKSHTYTSQGKKYTTGKRETAEYEVNVKKPLVVQNDDDINCAIQVYNTLHPDRCINGVFDENLFKYAKQDGEKITGSNAKMFYLDKANAKAIKNSGYDAIIYKTYNFKGGFEYSQLIIPVGSKAIKKKGK
jgi:hypothetical protein